MKTVVSLNHVVANALKKSRAVVTNGIGDCFSDAVFNLEDAYRLVEKGKRPLQKISEAKRFVEDVKSYDHVDTEDLRDMKSCIAAIDKAASNPTLETIKSARWACEKARASADGGPAKRSFWSTNSRACNSKFKVGDKVKLKRTGEVGTVFRITTNFGFTNYWVKGLPGGPTNSPVYAEDRLELANSRVCNAKFKVGDKVTDGNSVFQIIKVNPDDYEWKLIKGDGKDAFGKIISEGGMIPWADQKMRKVANSRTLNAMTKDDEKKIEGVLRMYLNKPGDRIEFKVHEGMPNGMSRTTVAVHAAYQDGQRETPDYRIRAAKKAVMDRLMIPCVGDGVRVMSDGSFAGNLVFMNSRACNSSNPVVRKAMNAVAMNAKSIDKWEFDIMLRSRIGDNGKGAEDYMRQNREQIEKDIGKDGFRRLCSKFGNTLAYNARNPIVRKAIAAI